MSQLARPPDPLSEMDANALKRKADELDTEDAELIAVDKFQRDRGTPEPGNIEQKLDVTTPKRSRMQSSSPLSSPASLTDADSFTNSPSPNPTPTYTTPSCQPGEDGASPQKQPSKPVAASSAAKSSLKRKRMTPSEKKAHEEEKEQKRQERELKKKENDEKKAKADAEKEQKKKEREEKKAEVEAEKQARAEEREAKRAKKVEEERKAKEEKERKEKSQMRLNTFFKVGASTQKKAPGVPDALESPSKTAAEVSAPAPAATTASATVALDSPQKVKQPAPQSMYEKLFKPFYLKSGVRMATNPFELDEETREAKSRILDEYISGVRGELEKRSFDPVQALDLVAPPRRRGRIHIPVKHTVERFRSLMEQAERKGNLEEQKSIQRETRQQLAKVPMKTLYFQQDVRPPYRGTVTLKPHSMGPQKMRRLARNPSNRIMPVDYGYDSEAEWQDEDGEDIDLDDEDEDDLDDGDEIANLIDDSEAVELTRFDGLEPQSSGLCWENRQRKGPEDSLHKYRMEFIIADGIEHGQGIDPFSTAYWDPEPAAPIRKGPKQMKLVEGGGVTVTAPSTATKMVDGERTKGKNAAGSTTIAGVPDGLADDDLDKIKKAIRSNYENAPRISKLGMIEFLRSSAVDGIKIRGKEISRGEVKAVIDAVAVRKKLKGGEVHWSLKSDCDN